MQQTGSAQQIDNEALKAQVDAEIAARLQLEADYAQFIHRRGFNVADLKLLVELDAASEVAEMPPLYRLPGAPQGVKGLANRHGRVVPVLDLLALFGEEKQEKQQEALWLLVYGRGEDAVGIAVDTLPDRKRFSIEDAVGLDEINHPIAQHAKAAYREGESVWIDVDMEGLFTSVFKVDPAANG